MDFLSLSQDFGHLDYEIPKFIECLEWRYQDKIPPDKTPPDKIPRTKSPGTKSPLGQNPPGQNPPGQNPPGQNPPSIFYILLTVIYFINSSK